MRGHLSPADYFDPAIFEREREKVFSKVWEFAGYAFDVPENNDFFLIKRGGAEIIVQNCKGAIKAFLNACPHRFSRIQCEEKGHRALICPYHGWTFNHEGRLLGFPQSETFEAPTEIKAKACLTEFPVERAGQLLFVGRDPKGPTFDQYFGQEAEFLRKVGNALGKRADYFRAEVPGNWKIVIENSLEGYHVPMVHPETLAEFAGMSKKAADVIDFIDEEADLDKPVALGSRSMHSFMKNKAEPEWLERFLKLAKKAGEWPFPMDHYIHHLFFPNLTITSFLGYSFHVQHFEAVGPELTRVDSSIFETKFEGGSEAFRNAIFPPMFTDNIKFTHVVFKEDERAVAGVAAGVKNLPQDQRAFISKKLEGRVGAFHRTWRTFQCL